MSETRSARHGTPRSLQRSSSPPNMVKPTAPFTISGRGELGDAKKSSCHPTQQLRESEKEAGRGRASQPVTHCTNQRLANAAAPASPFIEALRSAYVREACSSGARHAHFMRRQRENAAGRSVLRRQSRVCPRVEVDFAGVAGI